MAKQAKPIRLPPSKPFSTVTYRYKSEVWFDGEKGDTLETVVLPTAFHDATRESMKYGSALVYILRWSKETKDWEAIAVFQRGKEISLSKNPYSA